MPRLVAFVAVVLLLAIGSPPAASAQEATPAALPVTPDPAECTVAAPSIDELLARAGVTPLPGTPSPAEGIPPGATPAAFELPAGEPADPATVAAITATLRELLACFNTGNFLFLFEFITDDLFREFTAEPITEEEVAFLRATPAAFAPEQYASLMAVRDAVVLPDGRVGALVETIFPEEEPGVQVDFIYFAEQDGRWLIDEIVEDLEGQHPPVSGTPTP